MHLILLSWYLITGRQFIRWFSAKFGQEFMFWAHERRLYDVMNGEKIYFGRDMLRFLREKNYKVYCLL